MFLLRDLVLLCADFPHAGASYVLRSALPVQFMNDHIYTSQETAFIALRLVVHMFLHTKGDKAGKGPHQ